MRYILYIGFYRAIPNNIAASNSAFFSILGMPHPHIHITHATFQKYQNLPLHMPSVSKFQVYLKPKYPLPLILGKKSRFRGNHAKYLPLKNMCIVFFLKFTLNFRCRYKIFAAKVISINVEKPDIPLDPPPIKFQKMPPRFR